MMKLFGSSSCFTVKTGAEDTMSRAVRADRIPDPSVLQAELDAVLREIEAAEAEWERLDRRGNPGAFLQMTPLAETLQHLHARAAALPDQITDAERRRAAFAGLVVQFAAVEADVASLLQDMIERPPHEPDQRAGKVRDLDQLTRLHAGLAIHLRAVSSDRRFREPPDALFVLRQELVRRLGELDRLRLPGPKHPLTWPANILELLDTLEGPHTKEPV